MTTSALDQALTESSLRPLPELAAELLRSLDAPARLGAHLRAVHDVAWSLTDRLGRARPDLDFDTTATLFGAATHDIGKTIHPEELTRPGRRHEAAGRDLLISYGVPADLARFAGGHGSWDGSADLEELLVSLADQIWKGVRVRDLEDLVAAQLGGAPSLLLDDILRDLVTDADQRLAFQYSHPV
ncbi:HD domain-containing protein [Actinoplanes sp. NPDC051494]|uniref:HD domain-containing protein n=1 Tax=Actinoplanes sp. NPDC051494 TaxID=3363907 RepID=UPI00379E28DB